MARQIKVKVIEANWNCADTKKLIGKSGTVVKRYGNRLGMRDVSIKGKVHTLHVTELKAVGNSRDSTKI